MPIIRVSMPYVVGALLATIRLKIDVVHTFIILTVVAEEALYAAAIVCANAICAGAAVLAWARCTVVVRQRAARATTHRASHHRWDTRHVRVLLHHHAQSWTQLVGSRQAHVACIPDWAKPKLTDTCEQETHSTVSNRQPVAVSQSVEKPTASTNTLPPVRRVRSHSPVRVVLARTLAVSQQFSGAKKLLALEPAVACGTATFEGAHSRDVCTHPAVEAQLSIGGPAVVPSQRAMCVAREWT